MAAHPRALTFLLAAFCSGISLTGCSDSGKLASNAGSAEVVVYSSIDDVYARQIAELFHQQTAIEVKLVSDTEETKSTGLLNRLIAEKSRPVADVFWSGDPVRAAVLKTKRVAAPYASPNAAQLPPQFRDVDFFFTGFAARARVIIFNRRLLENGPLPKSVFDLADARFASKACIANPVFGTTAMHAAALFVTLGDEKAAAFFNSLAKNGVKMLSSNGEVRRRVAAGEFAIGLTDSDDVSVAIKDGQHVGFVLPDQDGIGTLLIPCAAVLISGGPNQENGRKFIDFLLSEEVERWMAASSAAHFPLRPTIPPPPLFDKSASEIRVMPVDYAALARKLEELNDGFLRRWVSEQTR